jgi:pyruvate dehydrogenase E2 component (dihydrolipoamide acetyltransferase)
VTVPTLPAWPDVDHSAFGPVEPAVPLARLRRIASPILTRNWQAVPHVTHHDEADVTSIDRQRREWTLASGRHPSLLPFVVKAVASALRALPQFNASLDSTGQMITRKHYCHVGVAIETPTGLLVAVVRDCDTKSPLDLAEEIEMMAARARSKGLPMSAMVGGCMTVSSLGHIGGTGFTPIINVPEVAILGLGRARVAPAPGLLPGQQIEWRTLLPLSLSYDHRVLDGADAARFCRIIATQLDQ